MDIKVLIKVVLYKFGLRQTLPSQWINRVRIVECGEPMVDIRNDSSFLFGGDLIEQDQVLLRAAVVEKLHMAQSSLPKGLRFKIYSAYRSLSSQAERWKTIMEENRHKHPQATEKELEAITKGQIANPRTGFGGHQTGGAIDITLCNSDGHDLDMGTNMHEHTPFTPMNPRTVSLSDLVYANRTLLKTSLQKVGFVNYPGEWWHYSFGDYLCFTSAPHLCSFGSVT